MDTQSSANETVFTLLERIVHTASQGSLLELSLISMALVTLMLITLLPSARQNSQSRRGQLRLSVGLGLIIVTMLAYGLTFTALVLGWTGLISLDALVTIVFPLTAALLQVPRDTMSDYLLRSLLRNKWEFNDFLRLTDTNFAYIKIGYPCGQDPNSGTWLDNFDGVCRRVKCKARIFMFRLPESNTSFSTVRWFLSAIRSRLSQRLVATFHRHPNHSCGCTHLQAYESGSADRAHEQWEGLRIGHTKHIVELRAKRFGAHFRMWNAVSGGAWLINKPWTLYLESQDQVLEGLSLISEICAIGNLVLFLRKQYLFDEVRVGKQGQQHWYHQEGRTTLIHTFFIEELNLVDWKPRFFRRVADARYHCSENYSLMFFLLIRKSRYLQCRIAARKFEPRPRSAHTLLTALMHGKDDDESFGAFERRLHATVDDWLVSWGCERDKLNAVMRATRGRRQWPVRELLSTDT